MKCGWRVAIKRRLQSAFTMAQAEVTIPPRTFGQTMRPDAWWTQPLLVFLGLATFIVYSTWAAFQGTTIISVRISRRFIRRRFSAIRRTAGSDQSRLVAGLAVVFAGAADSLGARRISADLLLLSRRVLQSVLGGSAGLHGGRAAEDLSGRTFVSAHHAERASLFSLSRAPVHFHSQPTMSGRRCGLSIRRRAKPRSASASARSCSRSMSFCSAASLLAVTRCAIWSADFAISFPNRPPATSA